MAILIVTALDTESQGDSLSAVHSPSNPTKGTSHAMHGIIVVVVVCVYVCVFMYVKVLAHASGRRLEVYVQWCLPQLLLHLSF